MDVFVARPFEGVNGEAELIAMMELLASATCEVRFAAHPQIPKRLQGTLVTLLPGGACALRTDENEILIALQTQVHSSDRSADVARSIITAATAPIGEFVAATVSHHREVRMQDLLDPSFALQPVVQPDFQWWHDLGVADPKLADDKEAVADMNESIIPATRIGDAAFFLEMNGRTQVRMVLPEAELIGTDAFARMLAAGEESLGTQTRWLGNFRTCGVLAPVWDVPSTWQAADAKAALATFLKGYQAAVAKTQSLSSAERQARATVVGKFVTLR